MNQDPPVLQPIDEKEFYNFIDNLNLDKLQTSENRFNGYMTNGSGTTSPPMPILYQADREPPNILNIQDIFSVLTRDDYETNNIDYSKTTPRKESDSLFEKIYKDYSTTLTNNTHVAVSVKDTTVPPKETIASDLNNSKLETEANKEKENNNNNQSISDKPLVETVSEKPKPKVQILKRNRKRKQKIVSEPVNEEEDFKKYGIKSISKKDRVKSSENNNKVTPTKDSSNKYLRSPYITLRKSTPKKQCQTVSIISTEYEIINPALRGNGEYQISSVYRPNLKNIYNNQILTAHPCICVFCGKTSEFLQLGNLYGPYFIDTESIPGLPLTSIFPSDNQQNSVIGVSGKSAIKTDKNGGLKMVIQSTRSVRNSHTKKSVIDDYRITWEGEIWFHRECILWAPCTYLRGDGKIGGLEEALKMALNAECCVCHKIGAILNCTTKNCDKNFHYYCAISQGSKLNNEQFSLLCNKHKEKW